MPPRTRSTPAVDDSIIAVVGGMIMDMLFECQKMPENDESLDADSLDLQPGGKGSNTAVAIYRAQHKKPVEKHMPPELADLPNDSVLRVDTKDTSERADKEVSRADHLVRVYLNTAVGKDDDFGKTLKKQLRQNGVNISGVRDMAKHQTGTCAVFIEVRGDKRQTRDIGYPGANTYWTPRDSRVECLTGDSGRKPDLVLCHLETKRETVIGVLENAARQGVDTLLNPSPVVYLVSGLYKSVTHLIVNSHEAAELSGDDELQTIAQWRKAAKYFIDHGVKNVVITLGERGAFWATETEDGLVPAEKPRKIKDPTGCGDTFVGNYALDYLRQKRLKKWDIRQAVERGCKAAARTIEQVGAQASIPWADEID